MGSGCSVTTTQVVTRSHTQIVIQEPEKESNDDDDVDILQEPETDSTPLDDVLDSYPPPAPSHRKKNDIYKREDYKEIDKHARSTPVDVGNSFEKLVEYLTAGLEHDLQKIRAIYVWVGTNQGSSESPPDSPNAIIAMVHKRKSTYTDIFTRLCRSAHIPCVIVRGVAKGYTYEVGDSADQVSQSNNRWNAVYVNGEWRIIFPLWAFSAKSGHVTGKYTLVETKGQSVRQKEEASEGHHITQFNDYYFLTDAEDFQYIAKADDSKWQLVRKPFSMEKFASVPYLRQTYFTNCIKISSEFNSCLLSANGRTEISFKAEDPETNLSLNYELFFNDEESSTTLPTTLLLDRFVFMQREKGKWSLLIRYPIKGVYKLEVNIGLNSSHICSFKLFAEDVTEEAQPWPCNPGKIGWGPNQDTENGGLASPSQKHGIVHFRHTKVTNFKFVMIRGIEVRTELVHNEIKSEELQRYVSQSTKLKQFQVNVQLPKTGEYGLRLYSKDKNSNTEENVCNYLLTTDSKQNYVTQKPKKENVTEKNVRTGLQDALEGKNLEKLTKAIEKFTKHDMDDKGDLTKALDRQEFLQLKKEIRDAINRRHLETLEKAIEHTTTSPYESDLADYVKEARELRDHLVKLDRFAHEILALKQTTVSELHSYKTPQIPVEDVMRATFLLLGVHNKYLQNWPDIQAFIRKLGRESLMNRVRKFDTVSVSKEMAMTAQGILNKHTEHNVRLASPAGGTFYVWAIRVVTDILG